MSFYQKHVFVCVNQKDSSKTSCFRSSSDGFISYMKANLEQLGLYGPAKIRISRSLCLGRCALGPSMVIYPEGTWYRYQSLADIDLIIQESLIHNRVIEHLLINEL